MTERRATPRRAIVLPALCWGRRRSDFYAVTVDIAAEGIRLKSATVPAIEERLTCSIRHVGLVDVRVVRVGTDEFAVRITSRYPPPGEIARRLMSLAQQQAHRAEPIRAHRRIVPKHRAVQVTLQSGAIVPAQILNLSASGVALYMNEPLSMGQSILVGHRLAKVARHFERGVGAAFAEPLDPRAVDEQIVL